MKTLRWDDQLPNCFQGLAFALHEDGGKHVGIFYSRDDGVVRFCHLAWDRVLMVENPRSEYFWSNAGLDDPNKAVLAEQFHYIGEHYPDALPYGLDASGSCFDSQGKYLPLPLGKGLTCATFIIAVFRSLGFELFAVDTWPSGREEDRQWANDVVQKLRQHGADPAHVNAVQQDIEDVRRFKPWHVAAAVREEEIPINFQDADRLAGEILADLAN